MENLEKEKIKMLMDRDFSGMDGMDDYLKVYLSCVEGNIKKPKKYQYNNKKQKNGLCEWEKENIYNTIRETTYWRVENMLHIINYVGLKTLCELNKQNAELLPTFVYCLNNFLEIDTLYEEHTQHFNYIGFDSLIKAILNTKIYNSPFQNDKRKIRNRIIFYSIIFRLSEKIINLDEQDVVIYDIDDALQSMLKELSIDFTTGITEDELIEKAINNQLIGRLVNVNDIKEIVRKKLNGIKEVKQMRKNKYNKGGKNNARGTRNG